MEADSAAVGVGDEPTVSAVSRAAGGDEEASTGDNSLTSCEDDVSTTTGALEELAMLEHYHRQPSSSTVAPHSSATAPGSSRHTLASGLPSSLQLCKVHTEHILLVDIQC